MRPGTRIRAVRTPEDLASLSDLVGEYVESLPFDLDFGDVDADRDLGHAIVRRDTVAEMAAAANVYGWLGFGEIGRHRHNPMPTARFYEARIGGPICASARAGGPSATPPELLEPPETPH